MQAVLSHVLSFIREHSLFTPGETVVVAVSGGPDSVALLDLLTRLPDLDLRLIVAHLNHRLRGNESEGDERFVASLAAAHGLPCVCESTDVAELSRRERLSLEDAGRRTRYAFFDRVAEQWGAASVALAHHADDQAETLLLRLLRGAGTTGLSAMTPRTAGKYVRPLLCLSRHQIEGYLHARGLSFRTDSSNTDITFLRNRIRHELIPHLSRFNPEISRTLAATADLLAVDEEVLEAATDQALVRVSCEGEGGGASFSVAALLRESRGIRYRLYRRVVALVKGDLTAVSFRHIRQIDDLVRSPKPNLTSVLPGGVRVVRSYETIGFCGNGSEVPWEGELLVEGPGSYLLPGGGELVVQVGVPPEELTLLPEQGCFDLARAPFPWLVRGVRPGDRITPLGMTGSRKVKELFIDAKVPLPLRRTIPLVFSDGELIWICGHRVGECARVTAETARVARAEVRQRRLK